jgi:hypothetical protein
MWSTAWRSTSSIILGLGQAHRAGDANRLGLIGGGVTRGDGEDAARVDVEGHLDLRHAARSGRQTIELELA